jgi:hypothetical protein
VLRLYDIEPTQVPDAVTGRPGLSLKGQRRAKAVSEALFVGEDGPPPPERLEWLCKEVSHFVAQAGLRGRLLVELCLWVVWWIAPFLAFSLPTFGRLDAPGRERALHKLEASPLGLSMVAIKAILCMIWYEHPDVGREVGFDIACLADVEAEEASAPPNAAEAASGGAEAAQPGEESPSGEVLP